MLQLADFISTYHGSTVGGCGGFPSGECTALACLWAVNLGLSTPCGYCGAPDHCDGACWDAVGCPNCAGWTFIANTQTNVPSPGDLVSYHDCPSEKIGPAGHVDIFVEGNVSSFTSFAQNWINRTCELVPHDYNCVTGWQTPTAGIPTPTPTPPTPTPPTPTPSPIPIIVPGSSSDDLVLLGALGLLAGGIALARSPRLRSTLGSDVSAIRRRLGQRP